MLAEAAFEPRLVAETCSAVTAYKDVAVKSLGLVAALAVQWHKSTSSAVEKCLCEEQLAESCWCAKALLWSALLKNLFGCFQPVYDDCHNS